MLLFPKVKVAYQYIDIKGLGYILGDFSQTHLNHHGLSKHGLRVEPPSKKKSAGLPDFFMKKDRPKCSQPYFCHNLTFPVQKVAKNIGYLCNFHKIAT
jgi:hypothetical protein